MKFLRRLAPSIRGLFAHKLRCTLVLAAIAAGVAAVLLTTAIGSGVQQELLRQTAAMGTNLLVVRPAPVKNTPARKTVRGVVTTLRLGDCRAIAQLPDVRDAVPGFGSTLTIRGAVNTVKAMVLGTTARYLDACQFRVREGRFVDENDNRAARRVAVLGARVEQMLFAGADPCGRGILIDGVPFEVVGVLEAKGVLADGSDEDTQVIIPIRTALRRVFNLTWLNPIFVSIEDPREMDQTATRIARLLRTRHRLDAVAKPDDFAIQDKTKLLAGQKRLADALATLSRGLAAISAFVGGTGILALMLMSVKERTGEIGLRIAVGARPGDILAQFLFEATLLSLGGWSAGVALGAAGAAAVAFCTTWKIGVPVNAVFASLGMAATAGIGFGWYPARKASLMPPIQALLVE